MECPLITIIVPCYKVEKYLPRCLDSIARQTYSHLEIFLVDDGSPDSSGKISDAYAAKDDRFCVIHKPNGGLSDARNVAIERASGVYIAFIDSDDYVEPDYIEVLVRLVEKYHCKMAVTSFNTFKGDEVAVKTSVIDTDDIWTPVQAVNNMFYQKDIETTAWGKLYHKSLFDSGIRFPKGILFEDLPTVYRLMLESDKVAYSNASTYHYLLRTDSIEGSSFNARKMESAMTILNLMNQHRDLLSTVYKAYLCRMVSFSFHILLMAPKGYPDTDILLDFVTRNRLSVLSDCHARKKARMACLLSYLGVSNVKRIFRIIQHKTKEK